jgi:hypothetical protein
LLSDRNFCQSVNHPQSWGWQGSHTLESIFLDESLMDVLEHLNNPMEEQMFNPLTAYNKTFTVEVQKQDGTLGTLTGKLVAPNYDGTPADLLAYCAGLLEKDLVPIYTSKGWRSFYQSKVVSFEFGG